MPRRIQTVIDVARVAMTIWPLVEWFLDRYSKRNRESDLARRIREYHTNQEDRPDGNGSEN